MIVILGMRIAIIGNSVSGKTTRAGTGAAGWHPASAIFPLAE
jgi:ABC-type transport system involved in cytochrome bd biosynthesis fused ATPase/permease subunit